MSGVYRKSELKRVSAFLKRAMNGRDVCRRSMASIHRCERVGERSISQKERDRVRVTHWLATAKGGCQGTERGQPSEGHSPARDHRGRVLSQHAQRHSRYCHSFPDIDRDGRATGCSEKRPHMPNLSNNGLPRNSKESSKSG